WDRRRRHSSELIPSLLVGWWHCVDDDHPDQQERVSGATSHGYRQRLVRDQRPSRSRSKRRSHEATGNPCPATKANLVGDFWERTRVAPISHATRLHCGLMNAPNSSCLRIALGLFVLLSVQLASAQE